MSRIRQVAVLIPCLNDEATIPKVLTDFRLITGNVPYFFGERMNRVLAGYRTISRRFVKPSLALSTGFETELTVHALELRLPIAEFMTPQRERAPASRFRRIPDGVRIVPLFVRHVPEERPVERLSALAAVLAAASILLVGPIGSNYLRTGLAPTLPIAFLSSGLMLGSFLSFARKSILSTIIGGPMETKPLQYLGIRIQPTRRPSR